MSVDDLIEAFEFIDDWQERYRYIIELGRKLEPMDDAAKVEANRVHGCQSRVWLVTALTEDRPPKLRFVADSDAHIVRGLIAVVQAIFDDKTPAQVLETDAEQVFGEIGLHEHLSTSRSNGLRAMVERIKELAKRAA